MNKLNTMKTIRKNYNKSYNKVKKLLRKNYNNELMGQLWDFLGQKWDKEILWCPTTCPTTPITQNLYTTIRQLYTPPLSPTTTTLPPLFQPPSNYHPRKSPFLHRILSKNYAQNFLSNFLNSIKASSILALAYAPTPKVPQSLVSPCLAEFWKSSFLEM